MLSTSSEPNVYLPPENATDLEVLSGSGSSGRSLAARSKISLMRSRPEASGSLSGF